MSSEKTTTTTKTTTAITAPTLRKHQIRIRYRDKNLRKGVELHFFENVSEVI